MRARIILTLVGISGLSIALWLYRQKEEECVCQDQKKEVKKVIGKEDHFAPQTKILQHKKKKTSRHAQSEPLSAINQNPLKANLADYRKTQVTIHNPTSQEMVVPLWDVENQGSTSFQPVQEVHLDPAETVHTMAMDQNPANGLTYLVSQLSNTVTILSKAEGQLAQIKLEPSSYPGTNSPVAIAFNDDPESATYGYSFVASSVADKIMVINDEHQVIEEIEAGTRPVSIAYNPITGKLYTANLAEHSVSIIDPVTLQAEGKLFAEGVNPRVVAVCPGTGRIYIGNTGDHSVTVYNSDHSLHQTFLKILNPVAMCYSNGEMLIINGGYDTITALDCETGETTTYPVQCAESIICDRENDSIYVGTSLGYAWVLNESKEIVDMIETSSSLIAIDRDTGALNQIDISSGTFQQLEEATAPLTYNEDYHEKIEDFRFNPASVKHVKFVMSGEDHPAVLHLKQYDMTGRAKTTPISLMSYSSPQHFQNVYDVSALEGSHINGRVGWYFPIAPGQTITVLVYYEQVKRRLSRVEPPTSALTVI